MCYAPSSGEGEAESGSEHAAEHRARFGSEVQCESMKGKADTEPCVAHPLCDGTGTPSRMRETQLPV